MQRILNIIKFFKRRCKLKKYWRSDHSLNKNHHTRREDYRNFFHTWCCKFYCLILVIYPTLYGDCQYNQSRHRHTVRNRCPECRNTLNLQHQVLQFSIIFSSYKNHLFEEIYRNSFNRNTMVINEQFIRKGHLWQLAPQPGHITFNYMKSDILVRCNVRKNNLLRKSFIGRKGYKNLEIAS